MGTGFLAPACENVLGPPGLWLVHTGYGTCCGGMGAKMKVLGLTDKAMCGVADELCNGRGLSG